MVCLGERSIYSCVVYSCGVLCFFNVTYVKLVGIIVFGNFSVPVDFLCACYFVTERGMLKSSAIIMDVPICQLCLSVGIICFMYLEALF